MKSVYSYRPEWYTHILSDPVSYQTSPFRICGNLFFVGNKDSATHLVDTGEGLILFDTGYPNMKEYLPQSIQQAGFDPKDIRMIFHTHGHFDHFGATALLKEMSGAVTYLSAVDARMLRQQPEMALCHYFPGYPIEILIPDEELEDNDVITLGKTTVRCILTPGHTPGAMSYEISVEEEGKRYIALLCGGAGFNTLNREFMEETGTNWRPLFEQSLEIWGTMKPDIFLGNHTPQSKTLERHEAGKIFIDRKAFPAYVADLKARYEKMIEEEG
ncbi:MAG: MBL fold metallo-hydrolase [Lachnospiraceae bacterium]|nr:MBL fold metallo-hydrolase [Lachnospiraceae bacterium]